jgi:hypothetical protein
MHRERALTSFELLLLLGMVALIAAIAVPGLRHARIVANEAAAVRLLLEIARAQARAKLQVWVDLDRDDEGEYVPLEELAGVPARGRQAAAPRWLDLELVWQEGIASYHGYYVQVHVPSAVAAKGEQPAALPVGGLAAADLCERQFVAYAWPIVHGATGYRTFAIDEQGVIVVNSSSTKVYSGTVSPLHHAAYRAGTAERGGMLGGDVGETTDGQRWTVLD